MIRQLYALCLVFLFILSCKNETAETASDTGTKSSNTEFAQLLEDYNQGGYELDPMVATNAGNTNYNDAFPNFLSADYKAKKKTYYESFKTKLSQIDVELLNDCLLYTSPSPRDA